MNYLRKVAYNTVTQAVGKILIVVISLILIAILTRYLGLRLYGFYALVTTYLALAGSFYDIGVGTIGTREIVKNPSQSSRILSNVFSLRFIFAIATFLGIVLISFLTYQGDEFLILRNAILIAAFTIIINNLTSSWITIFLAKLKMGHIALSEVINKVAVLLGVLIVIRYDLGFLMVIGVLVLGNLLQLIIVTLFAKYLFQLKIFFSRKYWPRLFRDAWPLGLFLIVASLLFRIDMVFISYLRGLEEVGLYGVSFKIFDVILGFAAFFAGSVFPIISYRIVIKDQIGLKRALRRSLEFMLFLSLPLVALFFFLSREIITLIATHEFLAAVPSLKLLSIGIVFGFFNLLFGYLLVAQNRQKIALVIITLGLIINVVLNLIFIPKYGFIAAAATTLLAQFIDFVLLGYFVFRFYHPELIVKNIFQILIGATLLVLFFSVFNSWSYGLGRFIIATLGMVLYGGILIAWNNEFRSIFFNLLKRKTK